jgi:hypothetical protein
MPLRRGIFLGDANALALPKAELLDRLDALPGLLPDLPGRNRIAAFADTFTGPFTEPADFAALAARGMRRLYIGLETGLEPLRRKVRKPNRGDEVVARVRAIKAGGVGVGLMVIVGLGGRRWSDAHVEATAALLDACGLDGRDVVFLSRLEADDPELDGLLEELETPSATDLALELEAHRRRLPRGVPAARYTLTGFVY